MLSLLLILHSDVTLVVGESATNTVKGLDTVSEKVPN